MTSILWHLAIIVSIIFPVNLFYSRLILLGIASARDDQHRMTPLNPWRLFMWKRKWRWIGLAVGLAPAVACGMVLGRYLRWTAHSGALPDLQTALSMFDAIDFMILLAVISFSCAAITVLTPRLTNSLFAATIGFLVGALFASGIALLLDKTAAPRRIDIAFKFITLPSTATFLLTWLYVRFVLNRAWFRLDA